MAETEVWDRWQPANEPEVVMYHALLRADPARYFQTVTTAPLYLAAVSEPTRQLVTWERGGRTHLLAFTSPEGMAHVLGRDADTVLQMDYAQLVRDWPDQAWWLALNPTTPIDATLPIGAVAEAASGAVEIPMPAVPAPLGLPALVVDGAGVPGPSNELEEAMAEVLAQRNIPLLLDLLVFAEVLLPTLRPVATADLDDPYFPWAAMPLSEDRPVGEPAVGVFTSAQRLAEAAPGLDVPSVPVSLLALAQAWPGADYALLVNPASSTRARLPGDQVAALAEWARLAAHYHGVDPSQE